MLLDEFGQIVPPTNACYWHAVGLPELCEFEPGSCPGTLDELVADRPPSKGGGGQVKALSEITDLTSTGRKRAAMLYPIYPGMVCQWSGLLFAGGGVEPITGCMGNLIFPAKDGTAGNIHHGPDKNTLNNAPDNVHLICWSCHQTWHALNNRYYGKRPAGDEPFLPKTEYAWLAHDGATWASEDTLRAVSGVRESINPRVADWTRRGVIPEDERLAA